MAYFKVEILGNTNSYLFTILNGIVEVRYEDLSIGLLEYVNFTGIGNSPLKYVKEFVNVKYPICNNNSKREKDSMDIFIDSSLNILRF